MISNSTKEQILQCFDGCGAGITSIEDDELYNRICFKVKLAWMGSEKQIKALQKITILCNQNNLTYSMISDPNLYQITFYFIEK